MNAWPAPIAYEAMAAPSMSRCGLAIISGTSLHAPGSDSSALTTRKCGLLSPFGRKLHFMPVAKPAPPRPRSPASRTSAMTSSRDMPSAFGSACQPPARRYPSMVQMSGWSQCAVSTGVRVSVTAAPSRARSPRGGRLRGRLADGARPPRPPGRGLGGPAPRAVGALAGRGRRHVVEELPVHHHPRRVHAGGVALQVLQADPAVGRGLVVAHAEVLVEFGEYLVAAQHAAHGVRAHAHVVLADRAALVHGVEADYPGDLGLTQPELGRAELDTVLGDVALLGLDEMEQRQQRRPRLRVLADDLRRVGVQTCQHIVAERHYLSTPPITGSRLAIAGIRSATWPPSHSAATDCRWLKEGSRRCTRYGRVPPSLTTCAPSSPRGDSIAA